MNDQERLLVSLGDRIARLRYLADLSQVELALRSGMSKNYLNDLEHGRRNASIAVLWRIASALDVPLSFLLEGVQANAAK